MLCIPVIDLFAGPGGLSEGFTACYAGKRFHIVLSVEKDFAAHKTLELRSFFRQFPRGEAPDLYYRYLRGELAERSELFDAFPDQAAQAHSSAWHATLGQVPLKEVVRRVETALANARHWVLLGGPPCQAYSVAGRARMKDMASYRLDDRHVLYREYLKIVATFQPTVFVMENVKGILSSRYQDERIFSRILEDLGAPWDSLSPSDAASLPRPRVLHGYRIFSFSTPATWECQLRPADFIIKSERYGLPQKRHRVILLGIRDDYNVIPSVLEEHWGKTPSVSAILDGLPRLRSRLSHGDTDGVGWADTIREEVHSKLGEYTDACLASDVIAVLDTLPVTLGGGGRVVPGGTPPQALTSWLWDDRIGGAVQHESRAHMPSDLHRYLYASCFAARYGRSPKVHEFPKPLWPNHRNAVANERGYVSNFADRFRVQVWDEASTTITAHLAKDGHYFIHPDPGQCRSLTVREAARLQTFPDNYFFEGNRGDQYKQVGNAVPPFLAYQLAGIVSEVFEQCLDQEVERSPTANIVYTSA
ncbi:DNA cytosine methyltransferase [Chloracidobacterium sp. MS 40/45]|uniref:DNA cytosine methyltransferase n=1 Tax=Chloracidobacterium aggregatum TaxID=2851959 RepID=UPI001B8D6652|nr:DNA cytosine methyltransferase [Chloracidobacterium aggregatum]QUW00017.1 DNA cytosine methyltransferase [Chloracidobacterium sp. MS 40/45]